MEAQIVAFRSSAPAAREAQLWASVRESLRRYSATPIGADIVRLLGSPFELWPLAEPGSDVLVGVYRVEA